MHVTRTSSVRAGDHCSFMLQNTTAAAARDARHRPKLSESAEKTRVNAETPTVTRTNVATFCDPLLCPVPGASRAASKRRGPVRLRLGSESPFRHWAQTTRESARFFGMSRTGPRSPVRCPREGRIAERGFGPHLALQTLGSRQRAVERVYRSVADIAPRPNGSWQRFKGHTGGRAIRVWLRGLAMWEGLDQGRAETRQNDLDGGCGTPHARKRTRTRA